MRVLLLIGITCVLDVLGQDSGYCDPDLCTDSWGKVSDHIGCPGVAKDECPSDARYVPIEKELRKVVLDKHNEYRNQLAGGEMSGFPSAKRMPTIEWDDELEYLAYLNVMQCVFEHDACHNTYQFKWSGQNIAWSDGYPSDKKAVEIGVDGWWDEHKDATEADIKEVGNSEHMIGHFTAMAQDRTNRIGCAASTYNGAERLLTCNYSFTNLQGSHVYETGPAASGCQSGTNSDYPNLCGTGEDVDPNP